ncbi:MAG: glycosyltransferase [Alphaproteobacteria bacterium]|nr:glycosyltransferase [Alphaproteobacteria bacterium]
MLHFIGNPYEFSENSYSLYETSSDELVKHAKRCLEAVTEVKIGDCTSSGKLTSNPSDILLGLPTWDKTYMSAPDWVKENALSEEKNAHPNTYIMTPWLPSFPQDWPMPHLKDQLSSAKRIFAICGEKWIEETKKLNNDSIQAKVKDKIVHINRGCNAEILPFKQNYSKDKRINFLHMSEVSSNNRLELIINSIAGLGIELYVGTKNLKFGGYSATIDEQGTAIPFDSIGHVHNSNKGFNEFAVNECDFYIHASEKEPQAAPILENCARGIVPIITKCCGFESDYAIYIGNDGNYNKDIISKAMDMSSSEYEERSKGVRKEILKNHSWDTIFNKVWTTIQETKE